MKIDPKWLTVGLTEEQVKGVIVVGWRALLVVHIAFACGWLAWTGISGFAYASDVQNVSDDVSAIKVELLEQRIFETRLRQCQSESAEPRTFYREKLQELLRKYRELMAADYALPGCREL
jgi:hypothetical protein